MCAHMIAVRLAFLFTYACVVVCSEVIAPINNFGDKPPIDFTLAGYTDMNPDDFVYFKTPGGFALPLHRLTAWTCGHQQQHQQPEY